MAVITEPHEEAVEIISTASKPATTKLTGKFIIGDNEVEVYKIDSISRKADFEEGITDEVQISMLMSLDAYENFVYPAKEILTFELTTSYLSELSDTDITDIPAKIIRYDVTLSEDINPQMQGQTSSDSKLSMINVTIDAVNKNLKPLLYTRITDLFVDTDPISVIRYLLGEISINTNKDTDSKIKGVNVVDYEVDISQRKKTHIFITPMTPLLRVPFYLHKEYGVYNGSINAYLRNKFWYVYPPYRTNRYNESDVKADIFVMPTTQYAGRERTYAYKDKQLLILAGNMTQRDTTEHNALRDGNGITFVSAKSLFNDFVTTKGNVSTTNPTKNITRYVIDDHKAGFSNTPMSQEKITDNKAFQASKLAKRRGQVVLVDWDNCDVDLIYPCMPCKLWYYDKTELRSLVGVILAIVSDTQTTEPGLSEVRYRTTSKLMLFVNKE